MKLGVVGSRTFNNYELLEDYIDNYFLEYLENKENGSAIVSGGAIGADSLAKRYADNHSLDCIEIFPNWNRDRKLGGIIRNQLIVNEADVILAFWDGKSKETKDTIGKARKVKKPTFIVYF